MTETEAIIDLQKFVKLKTSQKPAFLDVAIAALEKQIPQEPLIKEVSDEWMECKCPICHATLWRNFLVGTEMPNFCPKCGQKIDFKEE